MIGTDMSLADAIKHLDYSIGHNKWPCESCKQEHIQLRAWLQELRERRNTET